MFINDVIRKVYPIEESKSNDQATAKLGKELDRIYNQGGTWTINGIKPTMGEVAELYDIYKNIVHDHVKLNSIATISQTVSDILKSLGFNVKENGIGWVLTESRTYSFNDLPSWAKPIVKDRWGEEQTYMDLYYDRDFCELTLRNGGDVLTYRIHKDGSIGER